MTATDRTPGARGARRSRSSQTLARRQERRFARFQQRMAAAKTPDELLAAAALYARGVLTDLPPAAAERLAQETVQSLRRIAGRFVIEGGSR